MCCIYVCPTQEDYALERHNFQEYLCEDVSRLSRILACMYVFDVTRLQLRIERIQRNVIYLLEVWYYLSKLKFFKFSVKLSISHSIFVKQIYNMVTIFIFTLLNTKCLNQSHIYEIQCHFVIKYSIGELTPKWQIRKGWDDFWRKRSKFRTDTSAQLKCFINSTLYFASLN